MLNGENIKQSRHDQTVVAVVYSQVRLIASLGHKADYALNRIITLRASRQAAQLRQPDSNRLDVEMVKKTPP